MRGSTHGAAAPGAAAGHAGEGERLSEWDWLFQDIIIRRSFYNGYYVAIFVIMVLAVYIMHHYRFVRFSVFLWLTSGLIGLAWELTIFGLGIRHYNPGFVPGLELVYHALTEAGPGLIIMIIAAHQWGIVDLSHLRDGAVADSSHGPGRKTRRSGKDDVEGEFDLEGGDGP